MTAGGLDVGAEAGEVAWLRHRREGRPGSEATKPTEPRPPASADGSGQALPAGRLRAGPSRPLGGLSGKGGRRVKPKAQKAARGPYAAPGGLLRDREAGERWRWSRTGGVGHNVERWRGVRDHVRADIGSAGGERQEDDSGSHRDAGDRPEHVRDPDEPVGRVVHGVEADRVREGDGHRLEHERAESGERDRGIKRRQES